MIKLLSDILFPTLYDENFRLRLYKTTKEEYNIDYAIVIYKNIEIDDTIALRIHSECKTSETFGSLRCDCKEQLENMLLFISNIKKGMIIYLPQEGRGIGIINKLLTYKIQDKYNFNTFDANIFFNFEKDSRNYDICHEILSDFKVKNVVLFTNNINKFICIKKKYLNCTRVGILSSINNYNINYLITKSNDKDYFKSI